MSTQGSVVNSEQIRCSRDACALGLTRSLQGIRLDGVGVVTRTESRIVRCQEELRGFRSAERVQLSGGFQFVKANTTPSSAELCGW